jgi:hypothetical protein
VSQFQADVRNRWADGSVRFAVLSGVAPAGTVTIVKGGTPYTAANVAEPNIAAVVAFAGVVDANGGAVAGGGFSADIATARANGSGSWSRTSARKVREMLGPVMSEFHYFVPTADAHTHVWFYVRAYASGQTEVETVVQNGWTQVANPGRRTYNVTVTVGGSQRYSGTGIVQYHHTRWSRVDWVGTDPQVTPSHDRAYLQTTGLVPKMAVSSLHSDAYANYPNTGPKYTAWTRTLAEQPAPFSMGNIDPDLGAGGFTDNVGTLPAWDMVYLAEGDSRAYWAVLGNSRAAGVFCTHYTDEATGRPVKASSYPTLALNSTAVGVDEASGSSPLLTPAPTGGIEPTKFNGTGWKWSHGPKFGYLPYLLTGRWTYLEEAQHFSAVGALLKGNAKYNGFPYAAWWMQPRSIGHLLDYWGKTATITPERINDVPLTAGADHQQMVEAQGRWTASIQRYWNQYIPGGTQDTSATDRYWQNNALGAWYHNTFDDAATNVVEHSGQQWGFVANAWLWNFIAEAPTSETAKLEDIVKFAARWPVGMLGASASNPWGDYRLCFFYSMDVGTGPREGQQAPWANWAAAWMHLNSGGAWQGGTNPIPTLPADTKLRRFSIEGEVRNLGAALEEIDPGASDVNAFCWTVAGAYEASKKITIPGADLMASRFYESSSFQGALATSGSFRKLPGCAVIPRST